MEPTVRHQQLGNALYPLIAERTGEGLAPKVTGMLLELDVPRIVALLGSGALLDDAIADATSVLPAAAAMEISRDRTGSDETMAAPAPPHLDGGGRGRLDGDAAVGAARLSQAADVAIEPHSVGATAAVAPPAPPPGLAPPGLAPPGLARQARAARPRAAELAPPGLARDLRRGHMNAAVAGRSCDGRSDG